MYGRIIVGYDGREAGHDALALASLLAEGTEASLLITYVAIEEPRWYRTQRDYQRDMREQVHAILEPALASLPGAMDVRKASIASTSVARGLHDMAAEEHATLLVLGSTHRGAVGRVVLGSVGELLLMAAPCAVTVAPRGFAQGADNALGVVGVGFDGSPESEAAVESAHALAHALGARLRAIGVVERGRHLLEALRSHKLDDIRSELEQRLNAVLERLPRGPDVERSVLEGAPVDSLVAAARETDLMVVGSRGYGPMHHVLLGSVSAQLMREASCPLLVVPRGAPTPVEDLRAGRSAGADEGGPQGSQ